jgi:hypothetical protein
VVCIAVITDMASDQTSLEAAREDWGAHFMLLDDELWKQLFLPMDEELWKQLTESWRLIEESRRLLASADAGLKRQ